MVYTTKIVYYTPVRSVKTGVEGIDSTLLSGFSFVKTYGIL